MHAVLRLVISVLVAAVVFAAALTGCMPTVAYRTSSALPAEACVASRDRGLPESCRHAITETTPAYDLHFVEFDDQGWTHPRAASAGGAAPADESSEQLRLVMERLNAALAQHRHVRVFVFFHGWKHNAAFDDSNVVDFRDFLDESAQYERVAESGNRVIGIYVGWRGKSLDVGDPLLSTTFWERKSAAQHVAVGSVRELTAQLRAFQRHANGTQPGAAPRYDKPVAQPVRIYMIGHSFGGLALYASVSQSLVYGFISGEDIDGKRAPVERLGDMIVLINPAFEATRFQPLDRVARNRDYVSYQSPVFVALTSKADDATGKLFPLGRAINSAFETELTTEERTANRNTPGHIDAYLTHQLGLAASDAGNCRGWKASPQTAEERARNVQLEFDNSQAFRKGLSGGRWPRNAEGLPLPRRFCGGLELTPLGGPDTPYRNPDPNMPMWNVTVDGAVIPGHNDINQPIFRSFLRQLFLDEYLNADPGPAVRSLAPQLPR